MNLLLFLLFFAFSTLFVLGAYFLYNGLVPGGRGLIFGNPWAAALFPALLVALVAAQYRSVNHPGRFTATWGALALAFFLLLTISLPLVQKAPSIRSPDAAPLVAGRFLLLEGGSLLAPPGKALQGQFSQGVLYIPGGSQPMTLLPTLPFDPLNQRFVLPTELGGARNLLSVSPERAYFGYPGFFLSLQTDLFAIYQGLKSSLETNLTLYLAQAGVITLVFLGLFCFFSFRTWPLVQIILVLFMLRVCVAFLAYCLLGLPEVVQAWWPGSNFLRSWVPVGWMALAGLALFFTTIMTKPHQVETLS